MKIGWKQFATRKDKLEDIGRQGELLAPEQSWIAWQRLMDVMLEMSSPEGARLPKFNDLLLAIVRGITSGRKVMNNQPSRAPRSTGDYVEITAHHLWYTARKQLTVAEANDPQKVEDAIEECFWMLQAARNAARVCDELDKNPIGFAEQFFTKPNECEVCGGWVDSHEKLCNNCKPK